MNKELKKIVWLASYPKSGNTWFRIFLSNLLSEKGTPVNINELHSTPIASSRSLFDDNAGVSSSDLTLEEIEELRPEIYLQLARETKETLFHKVHDAWRLTPSGKTMFPEEITKGVLYFIRNPLDVTVSFSFHNSKPTADTARLVNNASHAFCKKNDRLYNQLLQPLLNWSGHVKSWVDESGLPVHVVRYEDMLNDTFVTFKKAAEFAGIEKSDSEIMAAIDASSIERLAGMEQKEGFREKPIGMQAFFRNGKSDSWIEHLDELTVNRLIEANRTLMKRFRYLK